MSEFSNLKAKLEQLQRQENNLNNILSKASKGILGSNKKVEESSKKIYKDADKKLINTMKEIRSVKKEIKKLASF